MQGYAVKNDLSSWRSCEDTDTLLPDETFYTSIPPGALSYAESVETNELTRLQELRANYDTIKAKYEIMITRLEQINSADPSGWTQAQFNQQAFLAIKDLASYQEQLLKFIAKLLK